MSNPCPFKALSTRIPIVIPIKGRGFINHGSGFGFRNLGICIGHTVASAWAV